ncbi:hypothetical protein LL240_06345 [Oceanimonas baumannii]|nr:hypothetical protein [Oceanimonas baumannii]MCC4264075.1 hypothetical protein [Oceanimonas baumannii]
MTESKQTTPMLPEAAVGIAEVDRQMSGMTFDERTWGELARRDEVKN